MNNKYLQELTDARVSLDLLPRDFSVAQALEQLVEAFVVRRKHLPSKPDLHGSRVANVSFEVVLDEILELLHGEIDHRRLATLKSMYAVVDLCRVMNLKRKRSN